MTDANKVHRIRRAMIDATDRLNEVLRPAFEEAGQGYALITFPKDGLPGPARFVSNVDRADMVRALKELVLRIESDDLVDDDDTPNPDTEEARRG